MDNHIKIETFHKGSLYFLYKSRIFYKYKGNNILTGYNTKIKIQYKLILDFLMKQLYILYKVVFFISIFLMIF